MNKLNLSGIILKVIAGVFFFFIVLSFNFGQSDISIDEIMDSAFPTELTPSMNSDLVAWVQNENGARNIFVYDGIQTSKISENKLDDGQAIGSLIVLLDNKGIIYTKGSAPNRSGETPNPLSYTTNQEREIWRVEIDTKMHTKLVNGYAPALSPDGESLIYMVGGKVNSLNLSENVSTFLFTARGGISNLTWSPNGDKVAFVSRRGDHSFIGVFNFSDNFIRYISPSVDNDSDPVWSPDGNKIAFIRTPGQGDVLPFIPMRSTLPWSIHVADAISFEAQEIWKASQGAGSAFRSISASNQLFWTENNRIVFPWEANGWTQLYGMDADGKNLKHLTPGNFEVQYVSLAHNKKEVIFSSNQNDIDRQHIWNVNANGGLPVQITKGEGIEWLPVSTISNIYALVSGPRTPAHPAKITNSSITSIDITGIKDYPSQKLVTPEQIIFSAADGMKIHGQLFLPPNMKQGEKYPAVLFFHGGSRRQMLLGFHHRDYYHNSYAFNQFMATQGYIVLSVNYRSGIGYGMEFREALNYGANGASEFKDVLGAGLYLRNRDDVDESRIGLWGGSYGGYLTALGLAKASDLFAAGVDIHGVHDWNNVIKNFVPGYDPVKRTEVARLAYDSSPIAYVKDWRSPVLLIHGDDDRNVPFSESVEIAESLRNNNVYFEQLIFPDEVHGFLLYSNWVNAFKASFDFFERMMK